MSGTAYDSRVNSVFSHQVMVHFVYALSWKKCSFYDVAEFSVSTLGVQLHSHFHYRLISRLTSRFICRFAYLISGNGVKCFSLFVMTSSNCLGFFSDYQSSKIQFTTT